MKTNIAENYAKEIIENIDEFSKEAVFNLIKQAFIDGASEENTDELQLIDIEDELQLIDIDDELQIDDEFNDAIDGNEFLAKLM